MNAEATARTVLIAGCAGFLGSHLTDRFAAAGWQVQGLDNLASGARANLAAAEATGRLRFEKADVIEPIDQQADLIVNLACTASPHRYQAVPIHTMRSSVQGALNLGELAVRLGVRILHSSTSEVYGDPQEHPQTEGYFGNVNPTGPRACYDEGKRAAETVLFDYRRQFGLDVAVARIFNTYGPRMDPYDGRVVSNFIRQALLGQPLTVYGTGRQTRSFCYVDDMVEGLWRMAHAPETDAGLVNLGNPEEVTVLELAEQVRELVGARVEFDFKPLPADDPKRRKPDIARAASTLGWTPEVRLKDGLRRTVDYFDDLIASGRIEDYALLDRNRLDRAAE